MGRKVNVLFAAHSAPPPCPRLTWVGVWCVAGAGASGGGSLNTSPSCSQPAALLLPIRALLTGFLDTITGFLDTLIGFLDTRTVFLDTLTVGVWCVAGAGAGGGGSSHARRHVRGPLCLLHRRIVRPNPDPACRVEGWVSGFRPQTLDRCMRPPCPWTTVPPATPNCTPDHPHPV